MALPPDARLEDLAGTLRIAPLAAHDRPDCARLLAASFGRTPARFRGALAASARDRVLLARLDGAVCATGTVRLREACFDGRLTRAAILVNVAVDQRFRGRGIGTRVANELLDDARRRGAEVALLVPRDERFWSRLGFQRGGERHEAEVALRHRPVRVGSNGWRRFETRDHVAVHALARRVARGREAAVVCDPGDRERRLRPPREAWVLDRSGALAGACIVSAGEEGVLLVHELLAVDLAAAQDTWAWLAARHDPARSVRWRVAPGDPLLSALDTRPSWRVRGAWAFRELDGRDVDMNALLGVHPRSLPALP